jgi:hypothetical protein
VIAPHGKLFFFIGPKLKQWLINCITFGGKYFGGALGPDFYALLAVSLLAFYSMAANRKVRNHLHAKLKYPTARESQILLTGTNIILFKTF